MRIVLMFFLLMLYNAFICEGADLKFHTLSPKDGLSFDGVIDIKQDGHGFIWILLDNNLFRFDGYSYKSYKANFVNGKDTTNYYFNNMAVNSEGRLHVATSKGGIYRFDSRSDNFAPLYNFLPNNILSTAAILSGLLIRTGRPTLMMSSTRFILLSKRESCLLADGFSAKKEMDCTYHPLLADLSL